MVLELFTLIESYGERELFLSVTHRSTLQEFKLGSNSLDSNVTLMFTFLKNTELDLLLSVI